VTNYLAGIQERLDLPEAQKQVAAQIAGGGADVAEKIAAIAGYIQTNYTYKAIEFGRRARTPQALSDVVRTRFGDCKDHSALAMEMLEAAGIPSFLALLNLTSPVREDLPSMDQFNHMIVCIPRPGSNIFLDCTAKSFDLKSAGYGLAGREALIMDASQPHFARIPDYATNAGVIRIHRSVELTNKTDEMIHQTVTFGGLHAGLYRDYFRSLAAANRRAAALRLFVGVSGEFQTFMLDGLDDPRGPLVAEMTCLLRGEFHSSEREIFGTPPLYFEKTFFLDQTVEKRTTPFQIAIPLTLEGTTDIMGPPHSRAKSGMAGVQKVENQFAAGQSFTTNDEKGFHINYRIYENAGRFPADDYPSHNHSLQQVLDSLGAKLVFDEKEN
jgi:hypothetical protein